jgi:hypothetical protein
VFTVLDRSSPVNGSKDAFNMKQSAAKTLGVAALGAAFAAAGAGVASAAPAPAVPDVAGLGNVTQALPTGNVTQALPTGNVTQALPGAGEALGQGQNALGAAVAAAQPTAERVVADGPAAPVAGLLGGLPAKGLPQGVPLNGIPLS